MTQTEQIQASVREVARTVASREAADVDARARFPSETLAALREAGALSAAVATELGGAGASVDELAEMCRTLGQACAASGMMLAMHHIQVLCIERHRGDSPEWAEYARRLVKEQRLIASVTSEVGPGGNLRESRAALEPDGDHLRVEKQATTISYGAHAHDLLLTARTGPDAALSDQALVLLEQGQYELQTSGVWDTLGMRGTCSPGAKVSARVPRWQVLPAPFAEVAGRTMVPTSHLLWSATWLGLAEGALSIAGKSVRERARRTPGQIPSSSRTLQKATRLHSALRGQLVAAARDYERRCASGDPAALSQLGFVLDINDLKLHASVAVVDIVTECIRTVGIMAYKNDTEASLGRHLRDAHSAALMINNDRIEDTNSSLLLVHKGY